MQKWKWKLLKQSGICIIIILSLALAQSVNIPALRRGTEVIVAKLSQNYSGHDILAFTKKAITTVSKTPAVITKAVLSNKKAQQYGIPTDNAKQGETVSVYAVGDGTVILAAENQQIGKFIKISHPDGAISVYGNCKKIFVKDLEEVKKGQIIATYENDGQRQFYYSFREPK